MSDEVNWRNKYKSIEQQLMNLLDEYNEVAVALGVPVDGFWGDAVWLHKDIVARAKEVTEKAWMYDELN